LLFLLTTLLACQPFGPIQSTPAGDTGPPFDPQTPLLVQPSVLDFGAVVVGEADAPLTLPVTVTNLSGAEVPVYGYTNLTGDGVFQVEAPPYTVLEGGASVELVVSFSPRTAADYTGGFSIVGGTAPVSLSGRGMAPVVDVSSDEPSTALVGCADSFDAHVTNRGDMPLTVDGVSFVYGDEYHLLDPPDWPKVLDIGERMRLTVSLAPMFSWDDDSARDDTMLVDSDDPQTPVSRLGLSVPLLWSSEVHEALTYYPDTMTDMLIMVDNTGTMSSRIQLASTAMPVLVDTLLDANVDLHAAVITGDGACPDGGFVASDDEEVLLSALRAGLSGDSGASSSALLVHAEEAVEESVDGGCLDGFLRENALLHVVVIAGSDDDSDTRLTNQIEAIRGAAPRSDGLVISALVGGDPGGCSGLSYGGTYLDAALSTGGIQADACDGDWSTAMEEIALVSAQRADGSMSMTLSPSPIPETLRVTIDSDLYTGWSYDPAASSLTFPEENAPSTGSALGVHYLMSVECED